MLKNLKSLCYLLAHDLHHIDQKHEANSNGECQRIFQCSKKPTLRKRIVFAVWDANISGGVRATFEVANGLLERGYDVEIVALQGNHSWFNLKVPIKYVEAKLTSLGYGRFRTKVFYRTLATALNIFANIFARNRLSFINKIANSFKCDLDWGKALAEAIPECDICIATWFPTALPVWIAGKGKAFYFMQDFPEQTKNFGQKQMLKATHRLPFYFLTDSNFLSGLVLENQGDAKVKTVGAGINPKTFFPRGPRRSNTVMAILSDSPNKGAETTIQALNSAHTVTPIHVFLVGSDAALKKIKPLFPYTFFNIPDIAPQHDEVLAELYSSTDVFVFSSTVEGFGLPPLEAMSCGALVVTTDCKGNRDYAVDEYNCLVVPPKNTCAIAKAINRILTEPSLRDRLRFGGFATAKSWTWKRVVDAFEEAFKENSFTSSIKN